MFAGLRNIKECLSRTLGKYKMELCFGDLQLKTGPSGKNLNGSINFVAPFKSGYVVCILCFYE